MTEVRVLVVAPDPVSGDLVLDALRHHRDVSIEGVVRIDPTLLVLVSTQAQNPEARSLIAKLSPRELEVLQGLVEGQTPHESAAQLHIAVNTLRSHTKHILAKLGASSSLQAASIAVRAGLRPSGDPVAIDLDAEAAKGAGDVDDQQIINLTTTLSQPDVLSAFRPSSEQ